MDNNFDEIIIETFKRPDKEKIAASFRFVRMATGMNRKELSEYLHIPYNTMRDWEQGLRSMPPYVLELIIYKLKNENKFIV